VEAMGIMRIFLSYLLVFVENLQNVCNIMPF